MPAPRLKRKPTIVEESAVVGHGNIGSKPVIFRDAKTVVTEDSLAFQEKKLCDGVVMNLGDACVFNCEFCYVDGEMRKIDTPFIKKYNQVHGTNCGFRDMVIRRRKDSAGGALAVLQDQITKGLDRRDEHLVLYTSTSVEIAPNLELLEETAAACRLIFDNTAWDIRLLSKSPLTKRLVEKNMIPKKHHQRLIFGFSTGTLEDKVAQTIETGAPLVSERLAALEWLQKNGYRTFAMLCPSIPQKNYDAMSKALCDAVDINRCEHVWAEVINPRGAALKRTAAALDAAGFKVEAELVRSVTGAENKVAWEEYARSTFMAHAKNIPAAKFRFLQYVSKTSRDWWATRQKDGAVLLGAENEATGNASERPSITVTSAPRNIAQEAKDEGDAIMLLEGKTGITEAERAQLAKWEKTVSRGLSAGLEAALCLYDIKTYRDGILWRENFETFEEYCRTKWDYRKTHAYRLLGAGEFIADLQASPIGEKKDCDWFPRSEAHIRPLLALPTKEAKLETWNRIVHETPAKELTAKLVAGKTREVAKEEGILLGKPQRKPSSRQSVLKTLAKLESLADSFTQPDRLRRLILSIKELL